MKEISWIKKICFRNTPDNYSEITRFPPRGGIEGGGKIALKLEKRIEIPFKISPLFVQVIIVLEI